jgi:anthranilate synthase
MSAYRYQTPHGIEVNRVASKANFRRGLKHVLRDLDRHRGIYLSSGYEYPGRYSRAGTSPPAGRPWRLSRTTAKSNSAR